MIISDMKSKPNHVFISLGFLFGDIRDILVHCGEICTESSWFLCPKLCHRCREAL